MALNSRKPVIVDNDRHEAVPRQRVAGVQEQVGLAGEASEWPAVLASALIQYFAHIALMVLAFYLIAGAHGAPSAVYDHSRRLFNEENPVLFNFKNRAFVSQVPAGIRRDINVKEMIIFIQKIEDFCTTFKEGEDFVHFAKNSRIRVQVESLISQNLYSLKAKQAELATIFDLGKNGSRNPLGRTCLMFLQHPPLSMAYTEWMALEAFRNIIEAFRNGQL